MLSTEKKALAEFQQALLDKLGSNLYLVELFGSKVRGEDYPDADLDLIVVLKDRTYEICKDVCGIALDISLKYDVDISPKIYSVDEFDNLVKQGFSFIKNVLKEGQILWQATKS